VFQHPPSSVPELAAEVLCVRMNEITAGQLHANTINIQDAQAIRINDLESQLDGMGLVLHVLRKRVEEMEGKLEESHSLSVMCQTLLTHYMESHWTPIAGLMEQIGSYAGCHLLTDASLPEPCDLSDGAIILKGENGSSHHSSPHPSLPSLESVTSSSIDSVYYTPAFLQSSQGSSSFVLPEVVPFVLQRRSPITPPTLSPSFAGDPGSFGLFDQGVVDKTGFTGFPLLGDEGWSSGGGGGDEVDTVGIGYRVGA